MYRGVYSWDNCTGARTVGTSVQGREQVAQLAVGGTVRATVQGRGGVQLAQLYRGGVQLAGREFFLIKFSTTGGTIT